LRNKNKITRKEEILHVAARLFKERGYSAVTMRDLAFEMGIKAASLYNHINSKQQILAEIVMTIALDFVQGMEEIIEDGGNAEKQLRKVIEQHVSLTIRHPNGMAALNNDWMHLEEKLDYYLKLRSDYEDDIRAIIKKGVSKGEIKDVSVDVILFSILSTLRSLYLWIPQKDDLNPEKLTQDLSKVLISGIDA